MKSKKKVYISGPITGRKRADYIQQFSDAESLVRLLGYRVVNPVKKFPARCPFLYRLFGYRLTLLYDLWLLMHCDYIYMMKGWRTSRGAMMEKAAAEIFGISILHGIV